jgi:ABC-type transport system involved in cytochrome c biogenesis permease subunit
MAGFYILGGGIFAVIVFAQSWLARRSKRAS